MRFNLRKLLIVVASVAAAICLIPWPARPEKVPLEVYWGFGSAGLGIGLLIEMAVSAFSPIAEQDKEVPPVRYSVRDVFWLTLVAALAVGWWLNREQLLSDIRARETKIDEVNASLVAAEAERKALATTRPAPPTLSRRQWRSD